MARRHKTRLDALRESLPRDYTVEVWSPGDGVTRYRFFYKAPPHQSYFGPKDGVYTALGLKAAKRFAARLR